MGHGIKECKKIPSGIEEFLEDDLPYSLDLKVELDILGKVSLRLGSNVKKSISQCSYLGEVDVNMAMNSGVGDGEPPDKAMMESA